MDRRRQGLPGQRGHGGRAHRDTEWSAAQQLQNKAWDQRVIATFDGSTGVAFLEGNLSAPQKTALGEDLPNKMKYLRGQDMDSPDYRSRSQKLADIVNSAPVFLDGVVYAGGNDGMLHAFDAGTGAEIFAYVPNLVFGTSSCRPNRPTPIVFTSTSPLP